MDQSMISWFLFILNIDIYFTLTIPLIPLWTFDVARHHLNLFLIGSLWSTIFKEWDLYQKFIHTSDQSWLWYQLCLTNICWSTIYISHVNRDQPAWRRTTSFLGPIIFTPKSETVSNRCCHWLITHLGMGFFLGVWEQTKKSVVRLVVYVEAKVDGVLSCGNNNYLIPRHCIGGWLNLQWWKYIIGIDIM